jgi:hypothetical protein
MFKFAQDGIVTWPVTLPVNEAGEVVATTVLVRLRVLTRKELRAIDKANQQQQLKRLADTLVETMAPAPAGLSDLERAALQRKKAEDALRTIDEAIAVGDEREEERTARLRARLVSYQPPGESSFRDFQPDELEHLLQHELLVAAFERGLMDASRGIVAKN